MGTITSGSDYTVIRRFAWPELQLNFWVFVVFGSSATCLGIFAWFMAVQSQMNLTSPWVFPFMVAAAGLAVLFVFFMLFLIFRRSLIPETIILGSFILFVLWLTGLIGTSIQLYGSLSNVNSNCQNYVYNMEQRGASINTLAWMTQVTICNCWRTVFALELINTVFFVWMMFMALKVRRETVFH